jgi:subfamily B ATP-binding cassette protein HlyB/CyaB
MDCPEDQAVSECLIAILRFNGIAVDREALKQEFGNKPPSCESVVRCARHYGLKARASRTTVARLEQTPLPAVAWDKDGKIRLVLKVADDRVLIQAGFPGRPEVISKAELQSLWSGRLVLITKRAALSDLRRHFDIGWFLGAMHKYRWVLGQVLVASFFLQIFALVTPLFFQVVVDKVLVSRGISTLDVLAIGLVAIGLFETVLATLRTYVFSHTTNRIDVELGARLYRHLLALPMAYFGARRVGDSVARVRELENIRQFITGSALTLVIDLAFTFVFLGVMAWYSGWLTLIVLISLPLYAVISLAVTPLFRARLDERFRRSSENQAFLVESVTAIETLKAGAVEPQMQRRWEEQLAGYVTASFRVTTLGNVASQGVQLISKLTTAAILFFGAHAVIRGRMTVGELVAFNMLSGRVTQPVLRLAQLWQDFHQARLSVQRLGDILNTPAEPISLPGRVTPPAMEGHIRLDAVWFRYRVDANEVLRNVNLTIPAGQVIGIVGASGSGKSTLAKMIQRLHVPEKGRVLVDGTDLALVDPHWLRRQIGVVLQENVLFNRSVRDNIALSDPGMPNAQVIEAAKLAGAHDFILQLPEGYDTILGERGGSLSGGQRQRVAIARALVTNPQVLILDEATSALDYEAEQAIQRNMRQICARRTVIIIAHRLSALRHCERIVTLHEGSIVEDGSHDELLKRGGQYAGLFRMQARMQEGFTDVA